MAKLRFAEDEFIFRVYVADVFRGICKALGSDVQVRYYDMIEDTGPKDTRTAEEVIASIREKLGGTHESDI